MKNLSYFVLLFCTSISIYAKETSLLRRQSKKDILSNGFFLNFGLGEGYLFPKNISVQAPNRSYATGIIASFELGNQWYFHTNETFGFGLQASYIQMGIGVVSSPIGGQELTLKEFRFGKIAAQFSKKLTEKTAVDLSIQLSPFCLFTAPSKDTSSYYYATNEIEFAGYTIGAGLRYRYRIFTFGADISMGNSYDNDYTIIYPRIYTGFKF